MHKKLLICIKIKLGQTYKWLHFGPEINQKLFHSKRSLINFQCHSTNTRGCSTSFNSHRAMEEPCIWFSILICRYKLPAANRFCPVNYKWNQSSAVYSVQHLSELAVKINSNKNQWYISDISPFFSILRLSWSLQSTSYFCSSFRNLPVVWITRFLLRWDSVTN